MSKVMSLLRSGAGCVSLKRVLLVCVLVGGLSVAASSAQAGGCHQGPGWGYGHPGYGPGYGYGYGYGHPGYYRGPVRGYPGYGPGFGPGFGPGPRYYRGNTVGFSSGNFGFIYNWR